MNQTTPEQLRAALEEHCRARRAELAAVTAAASAYNIYVEDEIAIVGRGLDHLLGGTCDTDGSRRDAIHRASGKMALDEANGHVRRSRDRADDAERAYNRLLANLPVTP